jgi:hypothetical protein
MKNKRKAKYGVTEEDITKKLKRLSGEESENDEAEDEYEDENDNYLPDLIGNSSEVLYNLKRKDLGKIDFDLENVLAGENSDFKSGFEDIGGTTVLWLAAGGDWEYPVQFILYIDQNGSLRGYIPEKGNIYCHHCKSAFGNDNCDYCEGKCSEDCDKPDWAAMEEDVKNRLVLVKDDGTEVDPSI